MTKHTDLQEKFPFLTGLEFNDVEYVGIVQNRDGQIISFYDIDKCRNSKEKRAMLDCGDLWWWESNRSIPINLYLKDEWMPFSNCKVIFNNKNLTLLSGPCTSLNDISQKRTKRKSITLMRDVD